jgi:hypothetical protein
LGGKSLLGSTGSKKLDEITNRVFLDLMRSKSVTDADKVPVRILMICHNSLLKLPLPFWWNCCDSLPVVFPIEFADG